MPARPDHAALTAAFHAAIVGGALPVGVTARDPSETEARFAVYRNTVVHSLVQAMRARFPVVERLVGDAFFAAMARIFVIDHPPESPVLQRYGDRFPAFLAGFPPVAGLPYLADVARLELSRGQAYHAADASPVVPEALSAAANAGDIGLTLHPSVRIVASDWPVWSIWAANQPGADGVVTDGGGQAVLVGRDPRLVVVTHPLPPDDHRFVAALQAGASFATALTIAGDGFDPSQALALLISAGLIAGATPITQDTP